MNFLLRFSQLLGDLRHTKLDVVERHQDRRVSGDAFQEDRNWYTALRRQRGDQADAERMQIINRSECLAAFRVALGDKHNGRSVCQRFSASRHAPLQFVQERDPECSQTAIREGFIAVGAAGIAEQETRLPALCELTAAPCANNGGVMQIGPRCQRLDRVMAFLPVEKTCDNADGVAVLPRDFVTLVVLVLTAILRFVGVDEESGVDSSGQAIREFAKKALSDNGAPTRRQESDILDPLPINVAFAVGLSRIEHPNLEGA